MRAAVQDAEKATRAKAPRQPLVLVGRKGVEGRRLYEARPAAGHPSNDDRYGTIRGPMSDSSGFRFEKDLFAVLLEKSPGALNLQDGPFHVLSETQVGTRIPDLLIVCSNTEQGGALPKLSYFDCTIVATTIRAGTVTVETLAETTFSPATEIARRVDRLVRRGLLTHDDNDRFRFSPRALPTKLRVVAVEAKLTRWKDALAQARTYLAFANEAYVAMPAQTVRRNVSALTACADAGIGVIAVDELDVSIVLQAVHRQPMSPEWVRVVSSVVALPHTRAKLSANASCHAR